MSTNTPPETRSVSLHHSGTSTRALAPICWFTRAREYQIHPRGVNIPSPPLIRRTDPELIDLPIRRRIELTTSRTTELQTMTAFLNPTGLRNRVNRRKRLP
jgi:hypothetical protein